MIPKIGILSFGITSRSPISISFCSQNRPWIHTSHYGESPSSCEFSAQWQLFANLGRPRPIFTCISLDCIRPSTTCFNEAKWIFHNPNAAMSCLGFDEGAAVISSFFSHSVNLDERATRQNHWFVQSLQNQLHFESTEYFSRYFGNFQRNIPRFSGFFGFVLIYWDFAGSAKKYEPEEYVKIFEN